MTVCVVTIVSTLGVNADSVKSSTITKTPLDYIFDAIFWFGIVLLIWGIVQYILSLKDVDGDSKQRAIKVVIIAIVLIIIGVIYKLVT